MVVFSALFLCTNTNLFFSCKQNFTSFASLFFVYVPCVFWCANRAFHRRRAHPLRQICIYEIHTARLRHVVKGFFVESSAFAIKRASNGIRPSPILHSSRQGRWADCKTCTPRTRSVTWLEKWVVENRTFVSLSAHNISHHTAGVNICFLLSFYTRLSANSLMHNCTHD